MTDDIIQPPVIERAKVFINGVEVNPDDYAPAPVIDTKITRLAFLERFTDAEAVQVDLASQGATVEAATMRRFMQKVNAATFIDLSRPDTIDGVNALAAYGFFTVERASEILTAPIQEIELP
ncbi:hypothetical protein Barba22A_gp121 [Rheinheimera phage vB_RspM_Barba22A]|jgi:hypothetical protein|uniref:Tail assembly protein n=48 Tax=Barbavirus TaxID=2733095 RepID=A0A4P8N0V7_9CAUD|nr:hypothetical protein HOV46_gp121 [Rheinheimera phage vB_RspM_Barba18A]YP_009823142.1 hypothetical protein HOV47_gp129 [Rheinheimera phage vB_RspM_Barba19A]QCQ57972.1 hypothetical protein Barba1A_gp121 [Rheinheimera phage vB_RspM_Barba1A]QCQ58108.1 hypothetical protein Barba1S_gp121 [Rheinheimera phage vB_RspM_Barba1S]QCQ58244.1 hypothetical protein Barba2A_gp121 [Rheinheimera phage vB_RspM_Barba2A]QCQ58379.1 hypothetical protein Barba2S_gp120 [Rheinheimera phage vB_RspM_Barba2S]QCQ58518.1 